MINIIYDFLPENIHADGKTYAVRTDFHSWIRYADQQSDQEKIQFLFSLLKQRPIPAYTESLSKALLAFYHADDLHNQTDQDDANSDADMLHKPPLFSWKLDSCYVLGDFRRFYQIDLRTASLHWWEFLSLFYALPEESRCQKRIYYRNLDLNQIKNKDEKKRIRKIKRAIAIPYEMSDDEIGQAFTLF